MFAALRRDIRTVLERDPAARSALEVLLCYPGVHALALHRIAHRLWHAGLTTLARAVSHAGRFLTVLPRGPVAAPPGFAWYDIGAIGGGHSADATFASSLQELDDLLDEVCTQHGKARGESIAAGFSQGGALAVAVGLRRSDRPHPAGVVAMSTYLPDVEGVEYDWEAAAGIPVLVQHGTNDPLMPVERGREREPESPAIASSLRRRLPSEQPRSSGSGDWRLRARRHLPLAGQERNGCDCIA